MLPYIIDVDEQTEVIQSELFEQDNESNISDENNETCENNENSDNSDELPPYSVVVTTGHHI